MHCKSCDYPLWNLTARQCPECGEAFKPSEYEFVPNSVRFCCPHCEQEYYGVGETGLPEPREFQCVECSHRVQLDEMVLLPGKDLAEKETKPGSVPWLERKHRGRFKALFQTIGMAMVSPVRLMRGVPAESSVGEALVYGITATITIFTIGALIPGVLWLLAYYGVGGLWGGGMFFFSIMFWFVPYFIFIPLGVVGLLVVWPMTAHFMLCITGGCRYGIDRTIQVFSYSAGANALSALPCAGVMFGWIWWIISAVIMLQSAQKVRGGRAVLAVISLPVLAMVVASAVYGAAYWGVTQMAGGMGMGVTTGGINTQTTSSLNQALISTGFQNTNRGIDHVIECAIGGQLSMFMGGMAGIGSGSTMLTNGSSKTTASDIPMGDNTLQDFLDGTTKEKLRFAADLLEALPNDTIAYRFGDYVFTHRGSQPFVMDSQLWSLVMLPDPEVNGIPAPGDKVHLATANYGVVEITYAELPAKLKAQNAHRQTLGLEPLPDLITIIHDCPAVPDSTPDAEESQDND